jgi:hypothetical protein
MLISSRFTGRAALFLVTVLVPALAAAPPALTATPPQSAPDPVATAMQAHITFLADDTLEGRGLGERGHEIAARYVASEFARAGLQPAGSDGWFQRINFAESRFVSPKETMAHSAGGKTVTWTNGVELAMSPGNTPGAETITAPLIFVGYGLKDDSIRIDDFAGLDVKGKIAVALSGYHPGMNSEMGAHLARTSKAIAALAAGAVGIIEVRTLHEAARAPWQKRASSARQPRRQLLEPDGAALGDGAGLRLRAALDDGAAAKPCGAPSNSTAAVREAAARGTVRGFDLPGTVTVRRDQSVARITSPNVIGMLPGTSPALAEEVVLILAHLDHVGMKTEAEAKPGEDRIFNGAMDNAAGIATLLQSARALGARPPRRSVLFLATTAEESGLLGADYFARVPTVPMSRIVGAVNIDMPILTCNFGDVVAFGAERSTMVAAVAAAARAEKLGVSPDPQPEEAVFTRSDHYPLVRAGVPAVFLKTGWKDAAGGQGCKAAERSFRLNSYHEVSDQLTLPFNWAAAAKFARLNTGIIRRLADAPAAPRWYAGDYFGDSFAPEAAKAKR